MNLPSDPGRKPEKVEADSSTQSTDEHRVKEEVGWVERLAQRSTGLPADEAANRRMEPKGDASLWRVAGLGIQFAATVALFAWMGHALDTRMGWSPWGLVSLSLLAVVGNLYLLIKESIRQDGQGKQRGESNVSVDAEKRRPPASGSGPGG